jgi:hypothetical protein
MKKIIVIMIFTLGILFLGINRVAAAKEVDMICNYTVNSDTYDLTIYTDFTVSANSSYAGSEGMVNWLTVDNGPIQTTYFNERTCPAFVIRELKTGLAVTYDQYGYYDISKMDSKVQEHNKKKNVTAAAMKLKSSKKGTNSTIAEDCYYSGEGDLVDYKAYKDQKFLIPKGSSDIQHNGHNDATATLKKDINDFKDSSGKWKCPTKLYACKNKENEMTADGYGLGVMTRYSFYTRAELIEDTGCNQGQVDNVFADAVEEKKKYKGDRLDEAIDYSTVNCNDLKQPEKANCEYAKEMEANKDDDKSDACTMIKRTGDPDGFFGLLKKIVGYVQIGTILLIIVLGVLDFTGAVGSDDDAAFKKAGGKFVKRLIAGALVFLVPALINTVLFVIKIGPCAEIGDDQSQVEELFN